ncbi:MAG: TIGR02099 family protein, partial [Herminiimonas sp.]|nr:TIGR02099 family protein [Herminiimonas sp.]
GWLRGALNAGVARDLKIKLKGNLADFPFNPAVAGDKPKGEFSVSGTIEKGRLNYAPAFTAKDGVAPLWPVINDINGTIAFNRTRMEIFARSATTHGVALVNVKAIIPDLLPIDKTLEIDGSAKGPLQELVGFTNDSPVAGWIGNFTEETKGSGMALLALKLQLPLNHMIDAKVQGVLALDNNDVILQNLIPPLLATSGKLEFNEKGLNLSGMRSTFLGGPVSIAGGTQRDGAIVIKADGTLSGEGLRKTYANTGIQKLSDRIAGSTRYTASIAVRKRRPEIVIESSMQGLSLDFPVPLRKAASESLPLKVELTGLASDDPTALRDEIRLSLGSAISARYLRQKPLDKNAAWKVLNGGIGVNVPAPQPDSGLVANVSLKSLNIDAWRTLVASAASGDKTKAAASSSDALGIAQYIEPEVLAARASELIVIGKKLDNVVVGASHAKGIWQANIDADQASGYISWNETATGSGPGRVTARLASLIIPKSAAAEVTDLLEGKNVSVQMPGLDIVAENFELFGKPFGRLDLKANNVRASALREWRIDKLAIANDDATFNASGKWTAKEGDNLTNLVYKLDIANAGKLLERVGFAGVLRGGKGRMEGDLNWKGLPFSLDIPSLSGNMQLDIAAGQFLKVDPGAAKLLGVLSLQSLPRRLSLDFRDVFSEGFAFDGITGNASISEGVAKTENLKMRSVNATVLMDGTADIDKETQNLHVAVIPEINVGTASIVYALAVNPVIGIGSFLAQLFLREPLMRAFTFEYRISGGWKDPQVAKLDRLTGAPVALPASRSPNKIESVN